MGKNKKPLTEVQVERRKAIISNLKSLIFPLILFGIIAGLIVFVVNFQNMEKEEPVIEIHAFAGDEEPIILENDSLKLTMDPLTTQFEVLVKSTGAVWKSNPDDVDSDSIALPDEKNKLKSTLLMTYSIESGLETTYDSYGYSVANGIYEIEEGDDYIRVDYSMGNVEKEYVIPPVITETNFKKWSANMDEKDAGLTKEYYKKYDIKKLTKKDNKDELIENYPIIESEVIYVLRDTTKENVKKQLQGFFEGAGYTYEDFLSDKELDLSQKTSDKPIFNASMIYRLDGDDLLVEVPYDSLEYKSEFPIYTITPLPYFGAGGKNDEGFLLVPEGGGSLIKFNNGRTSQTSYYANMYGWDMCLNRESVVHNTRAYYGVYGVSHKNQSFICVLEEGVPYSSIAADISGKNNSYNFVNSVFSVCQREKYDVGEIANSEIYTYIEELPDESMISRFSFVDSGSYVDMAKDYSGYLMNKYGDYLTLNDDASTPVVIEVVGAIDKVKQIAGFPISRPLKLTTYDETAEMITELKGEGMDNMSVKLLGWCNGGVQQKILKHISTIGTLGSKSDLKDLVKTSQDAGVDLYLDGITQYEKNSNIFNGFFSFTDAAKFISKERAELFLFSHITYKAREGWKSFYLLHTDLALEMADNLAEYAKELNAGVSYQDIGKDLSSDFYKKRTYSRNETMNLQTEKLKSVNDSGQKIMINMGNDYVAPYADFITSMDLRGSQYTILDECVPFYQLALHGYVNYSGDPINICGHTDDEVLYSAEYGAALSFCLMKESSFVLQNTLYPEYYGSDYSAWHDKMMEIYTRFNAELGHTYNQEMVGHENISSDVSCTEYEDGTLVYVNYGYEDFNAGEIVVPARDYLVVR